MYFPCTFSFASFKSRSHSNSYSDEVIDGSGTVDYDFKESEHDCYVLLAELTYDSLGHGLNGSPNSDGSQVAACDSVPDSHKHLTHFVFRWSVWQ